MVTVEVIRLLEKMGGDPFNEPVTPPETNIENLSEENKTLLNDLINALKTDPIFTNIPDNDKPNLETCKVNLYKSEYCIFAKETSQGQYETENKDAYVLLLKDGMDKKLLLLAVIENARYTFSNITYKPLHINNNVYVYSNDSKIQIQAKFVQNINEIVEINKYFLDLSNPEKFVYLSKSNDEMTYWILKDSKFYKVYERKAISETEQLSSSMFFAQDYSNDSQFKIEQGKVIETIKSINTTITYSQNSNNTYKVTSAGNLQINTDITIKKGNFIDFISECIKIFGN
ncbi:MAG: hypothetical protein P1P64_07425 [Treponemataceae bacterium]